MGYALGWDLEDGQLDQQWLDARNGKGLRFANWQGVREGREGFEFAGALSNTWRRMDPVEERQLTRQVGKDCPLPGLMFGDANLVGLEICDLSAYVPEGPQRQGITQPL